MFNCLKTYQSMGWPLLPCSVKTKKPITSHGFQDASRDLKQIEEWHRQYPECAWGVATSAERGVIDIDPRNGGNESLAKLIAEHGPMPDTPKVRTGGGGLHFWLRFPPSTRCGKVADGIDRKADGGYVIVPPSKIDIPVHEGRAYAWEIRPWELQIALAPSWLLGVKSKEKTVTVAKAVNPWIVQDFGADLLLHPGSLECERRKTLCQLVGIHLARNDSVASIYSMAEKWAERCQPYFGEWQKHVERLMAKEEEKELKMTTLSSSFPSPKHGIPHN